MGRLVEVDKEFIDRHVVRSILREYTLPKWIKFCSFFLNRGLKVVVYDVIHTESKYVTLHTASGRTYKVRFSAHPPNKKKEKLKDCDFFVGRNNYSWTTTEQAVHAAMLHFFKCKDKADRITEAFLNAKEA